MNIVDVVFPPAEQAAAFFGAAEDGLFVMVNLLKFRERADYRDGRDAGLSGREAYARYGAGVQACLAAVDAKSLYAGAVADLMLGEVYELWGHGRARAISVEQDDDEDDPIVRLSGDRKASHRGFGGSAQHPHQSQQGKGRFPVPF
jgi:hypothetical protein